MRHGTAVKVWIRRSLTYWERLPVVNDDSDAASALTGYHTSVLAGDARHRADSLTCTPTTLPPIPTLSSSSFASEDSQNDTPGFAGIQLPQDTPPLLDIYTPSTNTWSTVSPAPDPEHGFPGARSVHGLVPFIAGTHANTFETWPVPVALLYHGERDTSSLGHAGAGVFWDDAWLLLAASSALQWKKLRIDVTHRTGNPAPEPRGWFAPASYVHDGKTRVVLSVGLLSSNGRSSETRLALRADEKNWPLIAEQLVVQYIHRSALHDGPLLFRHI
ncbi:hypothetical protein OG21DRAFT_1501830 [Imleria badia]|nr:hypothetical protein OG21DRAFT_1501830 [Imleria badia]